MHHREQATQTIRKEVAHILERYIEDPCLKNITITVVTLSKKADYADIKITQLNAEYTIEKTIDSLQKAAGRIRYHLAKLRSRARYVPKLRFHHDIALEESTRLNQLINEAINLY